MRLVHQPPSVAVEEAADALVIVYRWFSWTHLLLAIAGGVVLAPLALLLPKIVGEILALVIGAMAVYVAAVTLGNRSTITATREWLRAAHGPIPVVAGDAMDALGFWPDVASVSVPAARLVAIEKGKRDVVYTRDDEARTKVYLHALLHDGAGVVPAQLLPSSAPPPVEDYVGAYLDRWFSAADLPLYRGADLSEP
jgi:hypothetical protein